MKKTSKAAPHDPIAKVLAAGGRVPKKFIKARPASAGPTLGAKEALIKITPARRVAFEILTLVGEGKGHSDELLHGVRMKDLSEADKHLATALVMGVLRWQIALDARVRSFLERPDQRIAEPVVLALRMGAFQLLHMDRIPAHAALSESVEMCRAAGQPHATGMVNAILRKVATAPAPGHPHLRIDRRLRRAPRHPAWLAERLGHPAWLAARWVASYGRADALKICEADQEEPGRGGLFAVPESGPEDGLPEIDDGSRLIAELASAALPQVEGRPGAHLGLLCRTRWQDPRPRRPLTRRRPARHRRQRQTHGRDAGAAPALPLCRQHRYRRHRRGQTS